MTGLSLSLRLLPVLIALSFVSLLCGDAPVGLSDLLDWMGGAGNNGFAAIIFGDIRAPRVALAALNGLILGMAGAAIQGLLRNPLAEPSLLGASNAAALGAVVAIYLGLSGTLSFIVPAFAALAALASVVVLLLFAGKSPSSLRLILAGFAVSALAGAMISLVLNLSPNIFAALEIAFWLLGAVENRSWAHVWLALPGSMLGLCLLASCARALDALALGDRVAESLGTDLRYLNIRMALGLALALGSVVAVTGVIGFVGLVAPHLVRPFCGYRPSQILLPSALVGAIMLIAADSLIRLLPVSPELKLGVLTAFLGVPLLLYLLRLPHFRKLA